ncbi:MAG: hypothetical protein WDN28_15765 [Chthoniobacter sp.]
MAGITSPLTSTLKSMSRFFRPGHEFVGRVLVALAREQFAFAGVQTTAGESDRGENQKDFFA